MRSIRIPKSHKNGFQIFFSASKEEQEKILGYLLKAPKGISVETWIDLYSEDVEGYDEKLKSSLNSLGSLFGVYAALEEPFSVFLDTLFHSLVASEIIAPEEIGKVESLLKALFDGQNNLEFTSKLENLTLDREKLFEKSKILTDARPIFEEDDPDKILGWTVIHTLKFSYRDNTGGKESYLAIDRNDLDRLKKQIIRAERKEDAIRESYNSKLDLDIFDLK